MRTSPCSTCVLDLPRAHPSRLPSLTCKNKRIVEAIFWRGEGKKLWHVRSVAARLQSPVRFRLHAAHLRVGKNRLHIAASRIPSHLSSLPMNRKRRRAIQAQADDVADRLNEYGPGRPDGAKRRPRRPLGNSRQALLRRLRHDHPQLHELVLSGQISPFRAACVAGFRRPPGKKPTRPVDPTEEGQQHPTGLVQKIASP
jgi:hypothetical protein